MGFSPRVRGSTARLLGLAWLVQEGGCGWLVLSLFFYSILLIYFYFLVGVWGGFASCNLFPSLPSSFLLLPMWQWLPRVDWVGQIGSGLGESRSEVVIGSAARTRFVCAGCVWFQVLFPTSPVLC